MAENFKPLLSDFWLNFFMWVFSILALGTLIWFTLYVNNSKKKVAKTVIIGMSLAAFFMAIALQLIMIRNDIVFQ